MQRLCFQTPSSVSSTPNEVSGIPFVLFGNTLRALFLKNRDFFCYGEIFLPNTRGPLGCLLGFWPSGSKPYWATKDVICCSNGYIYHFLEGILGRNLPIKFPGVHVSYQTKSNKISIELNRTLCNKRVQCSSAIERNRTQNVCVSSMPKRNRIIERTRFQPYNDCSFSALATEK